MHIVYCCTCNRKFLHKECILHVYIARLNECSAPNGCGCDVEALCKLCARADGSCLAHLHQIIRRNQRYMPIEDASESRGRKANVLFFRKHGQTLRCSHMYPRGSVFAFVGCEALAHASLHTDQRYFKSRSHQNKRAIEVPREKVGNKNEDSKVGLRTSHTCGRWRKISKT